MDLLVNRSSNDIMYCLSYEDKLKFLMHNDCYFKRQSLDYLIVLVAVGKMSLLRQKHCDKAWFCLTEKELIKEVNSICNKFNTREKFLEAFNQIKYLMT